MNNSWTGGQYSLFRIVFGLYLFIHFVNLSPWEAELFSHRGVLPEGAVSPLLYAFPNLLAFADSPLMVIGFLVIGIVLSVLFATGVYDRACALGLWYIWACLFGRNPLIANPSLPFVGWMLLAHACLPAAPYGSWAARGRVDPADGWRFPQDLYAVAWIVMALSYSYSGYTKLISPSWVDGTALSKVLNNPLARPSFIRELLLTLPDPMLNVATWGALSLELFFAPLALFSVLRSWLWGAVLAMHVGLLVLIDFADLSVGMVLLHFFTFNPAWIASLKAAGVDTIFYDGHCGLCHRTIRFLLAEDQQGERFCFAPLESDAFVAAIAEKDRQSLPDSIIVLTQKKNVLTRSTAVLYLLQRLGGIWRVFGSVLGLLPTRWSDAVYDGVAHIRSRVFSAPTEACPLIPAALRYRFRS